MCRKHTRYVSGIIGYQSPKSAKDEIKENVELKMVISLFPKCVLPNLYKIIGLYLLIYIENKETIGLWSNGLWSNGLIKARDKIKS